jgi:FtsP/CotA-like multicopper oxidase with cupredoxin domain
MYKSSVFHALKASCLVLVCGLLVSISSAQPSAKSTAIRANDNRVAAGELKDGTLTLHLELTSGDWYPEADDGPSMKIDAFAEAGKAPQIPGPLVRVPQGTEIRVSFHNTLAATAILHGMHQHPGDAKDVIEIPAGETREVHFLAGEPGTYQYFANAGGPIYRFGRGFREDSQLSGAFIVDPPGSLAHDRVFVLGMWRSETAPTLSKDVGVINGKSWPFTEKLSYTAGEEAHWRLLNASDVNHPMHLHGSYYRVDSQGDGEHDKSFTTADQRMVVTQLLTPGSSMSATWTAVPGRWVFHCHLSPHMSPSRTVAVALSPEPEQVHDHGGPNHMAGLVIGIDVPGERPHVATHGRVRKLRLLVRERPAVNGVSAGFGYQLEESHKLSPAVATLPGPTLVLERGRPVEITVVNQLNEATAVHWHGMELESYYDGVAGWGMHGHDLTPRIAPGQSFCARFTPPRAGTFIYHTHLDDEIQLASGLYGAMIVVDPGTKFEPGTDQLFVVSAWGGPRSLDSKVPISGLLNGNPQPAALHWRVGQKYRVRLIDIASAMIGQLSVTEKDSLVQWRAHAKDGADLPASQALLQDAKLVIAPGETYDFEYQPSHPGPLKMEFKALAVPVDLIQEIEVE